MPLRMPVQRDQLRVFLKNGFSLTLEEYLTAIMLENGDPKISITRKKRLHLYSLMANKIVDYCQRTGKWELTHWGRTMLSVVDKYRTSNTGGELIEFPTIDKLETNRETVNT